MRMMGQLPPGQNALFYQFCIDNHVPSDHLLRAIDAVLDLERLRSHLTPYYSMIGGPSIDPELMIRMLLVGYGIRSERRLCEEVHLNLAYRWFCRLGLEGAVPDHSTFSKNRHGRFRDSGCLRWVFGEVLRGCMSAGLIKGKGFAVDASLSKADANRQRAVAGSETIDWGDRRRATRAVREYLDALEADPSEAPAPKSISLTDPLSQWTAAANGAAFFAYSTNYLIDTAWGIILDVQATTANRAAEVESTKTMLERVEAGLGITPERLIGDTAYGTAPMLGWLVEEKGIDPHVPVWDKSERTDGSFSCSEFRWDAEANTYTCPAGKQLRCDRRNFTQPHHNITQADTVIYRSSKFDCESCPLTSKCGPNTPQRRIARRIHEGARALARRIAQTPEYQRSRHERKKVEMLFAHLKRILRLDRLRLRGLTGASDEFTLAATAQNLRRWAKFHALAPPSTG
jgi:transposase